MNGRDWCQGLLAGVAAVDAGLGGASLVDRISARQSVTSWRMPEWASSRVGESQLRDGNSAHSPTYSPSSSDQMTLYVYFSVITSPPISR